MTQPPDVSWQAVAEAVVEQWGAAVDAGDPDRFNGGYLVEWIAEHVELARAALVPTYDNTQINAARLLEQMKQALEAMCPTCYRELYSMGLRHGDFWDEVKEYDDRLDWDHSDCVVLVCSDCERLRTVDGGLCPKCRPN